MKTPGAESVRRCNFTYLALFGALLAGEALIGHLTWTLSPWAHTALEFVVTALACIAGVMAVVRYYAQKSLSRLILGNGLLGASLLNAFHTVITSPLCGHCTPASLPHLVGWSGIVSELFLAVLLCCRTFVSKVDRGCDQEIGIPERTVSLAVSASALTSVAILLLATLRPAYAPGGLLHWPADLVAGILFGIAALGHWRNGWWKASIFEQWLIYFLITAVIEHSVYTPFSGQTFGSEMSLAHMLKLASYVFLMLGLLASVLSILRLAASIRDLNVDQLLGLSSKMAILLTQCRSIPETLQRSAELTLSSLHVAFVGIWTLNREQNILELKASAGMGSGLAGLHDRIPLDQWKIGRIAAEEKPYVTNRVQDEAWVGDPQWTKREGIVSFVGFPLIIDQRTEGVIVALARRPLPETAALLVMGSIAGALVLYIGRKQAETGLRESEERVRLLLDSTAEAICGIDLEGNTTFANRACLEMLGCSQPADLLGRNMDQVWHSAHSDGTPLSPDCAIHRGLRDGERTHADGEVFWRSDGTCFPVEYWCYPIVREGKVAGAVITFLDISARKRAEEEQHTLAALFEASNDFIAVASPQKKLLYLNRGGANMIGLENPRQAIGWDISTLHPAASWVQIEATIPNVFETGRFDLETQLRHLKTGQPIDVVLSSFALRSPETGGVIRLAAIMHDITRRKRAEEALRISAERFRIAAENASDLIIDWDLRTGEAEIFGAASFGDLPVPTTFEAWKSMVHPDDLGRILEALELHIQTGERFIDEYRILGQRGDVFTYSVRGQAIRNTEGEPYRWIGLLSDITERSKAEQALAQLAAIVQSSEDAIIGISPAGRITSWNLGAQKLLGYSAAEKLGDSVSILLPENHVGDILDRSARGEVSRFDELALLSKSGATLPVSLTLSPIRNGAGSVAGVAAIARDIRRRKKAERELEYQARHDHLTGLPNRALLAERLEASISRAAMSGLTAAVIYLDLDGFKIVNDTLGHDAGDALLQKITERLRSCIREPDTLARMGGDEFMIVVNGLRSDEPALTIAERLAQEIRKPVAVFGREVYVTASIGISMYPRDGSDVSILRQNADAAMYEAKHSGKDKILFFTAAMRDSFLERLRLETALRRALEHGDFVLHFQPIFEVTGSHQTAFEALVRWQDDSRALIAPAKFIPVAEEIGLIAKLGDWVIREACRKCRSWQAGSLHSVRVAVNVSPIHFGKIDFVENVFRILDETGLSGDLLEVEVTESMFLRDLQDAIEKMIRLRERGVRISIDDFGTGYSSLGYLPRLPVDTIKIDQSFVAGLGTTPSAYPLIRGMISLAHSIDRRVIVEGVETESQLAILRELGCDEVQGFLLGRPAALPQF